MDWEFAIRRQREALRRIVAALVLMAAGADTLPRHLHRAVLRLLRPAEAAARRLVIAMAHTLPPPPALRATSPASQGRNGSTFVKKGGGTGIVMPATPPAARVPLKRLALPLFDPLRTPFGRRLQAASGVPRISVPGFTRLHPVAPRFPPTPDDSISAARLNLRLRAVGDVLDDLPTAARRFARWRAARDAAVAQERESGDAAKNAGAPGARKPRRIWPLRPGRPPGSCRRAVHEVQEVLKDAHWLAMTALQRPDTS